MVVVMMTRFAIVFAKRIQHGIIGGRNQVDDPFFDEGLEGAVNRYPVKHFAGLFLDVGVGQRSITIKEQFKDFFPAISDTELIFF